MGTPQPPKKMRLTAEGAKQMGEGISLVLSRWSEFQVAIDEGWGGPHSRHKAISFANSILNYFVHPNPEIYTDDLEVLLNRGMHSFGLVLDEVDSIQEVADILMTMHEECLENNYQSILKLRATIPPPRVMRKAVYISDDDDDVVDGTDENVKSSLEQDDEFQGKELDNEAGWIRVTSKKRKGKKRSRVGVSI